MRLGIFNETEFVVYFHKRVRGLIQFKAAANKHVKESFLLLIASRKQSSEWVSWVQVGYIHLSILQLLLLLFRSIRLNSTLRW